MEKIIVQKLHEIEEKEHGKILLAGQWILEKESPPPMLFSELVEAELPDEVRTEVEDLLKIKIHESEIKKIPRVNRLNDYLESEIAGLREKAGKLGEEKR